MPQTARRYEDYSTASSNSSHVISGQQLEQSGDRNSRARAGNVSFYFLILLTLAFRFYYSAVAALMAPYLTLNPGFIFQNKLTAELIDRSEGVRYAILGVWQRFDTLWYLHIAGSGYDRPDAVVFYPLYPVLIRLFSLFLEPLVAALLVSTLSLFFLLWGLERLLSLDFNSSEVKRALVLCGAWPAAFIFVAGYADSLVAALIVWSVYFARTDRWLLCGLTGVLAGLAKAVGMLSIVPAAVIALRGRRWNAWPAALCLLGPLLYAWFLATIHQPLPPAAYARYWKTTSTWPWITLRDSIGHVIHTGDVPVALNLILFGFMFLFVFIRRTNAAYVLYGLALLTLCLLKNSVPVQQQWARYALVAFPAYPNLAVFLKDNAVFTGVVVFFSLLNLVLLRAFLEWSMVV